MSGQPPAEPEAPIAQRVRSSSKTRISLLVAGIAVLIALAVAKPWVGPPPPPIIVYRTSPPGPTPIAPTQPPPTQPAPTQPPAIAPVDPIALIDWESVGAALRPHDAWGIRTVVYRSDNTVREGWTPVKSSDADVQAADNNADAYAVIGDSGTIAALGITTPLDDLPLDVRAWRDTQTTPATAVAWRNLVLTGITPSGDPSTRLLRLPTDWSSENDWPPGEYELDVLLESGVLHVHLWLDGDAGPIPAMPAPRAAPSDKSLRALAAEPGGFIASGTDATSYVFVGLPETDESHDEQAAWLALTSDRVFFEPGLVTRQSPLFGTANLLGAAVPAGQVIRSARLTELAPQNRALGIADILPGAPGKAGRPGAVAVFRAADPAVGFPDAVYRIDAKVQTKHGNVDMSWDLPVLTRPTTTESPLLVADRDWSSLSIDGWAVLAPGYPAIPVTPSSANSLTPDPGQACGDSPSVGTAPIYVGVAHPGPAFRSVTVEDLGASSTGTAVPVQVSQLAQGVVALRPIGTVWPTGRYEILMQSGTTQVQSVTFCVS